MCEKTYILKLRTDPSRLQCLALQLSDKIVQLMENNEKLLERGSGWSQRNWENNKNREGGGNYRGGRDGGNFRGRVRVIFLYSYQIKYLSLRYKV